MYAMRLAICDDNPADLAHLTSLLPGHHITTYTSGESLLMADIVAYDYIFLDVDMPGLSGFETAEKIRAKSPGTGLIFVTHQAEDMHKGFKYRAFDYLIKPATPSHISQLLPRLQEVLASKAEALRNTYPITLKHLHQTMLLPLGDVMYFESANQYIVAVTATAHYEFRGNMQQVAEDLAEKGFLRSHRSYLVNTRHVFKAWPGNIQLIGGKTIPIGRGFKKIVDLVLGRRW